MEALNNLKTIYENGFISEAEYEHRKAQIIDKLTDTCNNLAPMQDCTSSMEVPDYLAPCEDKLDTSFSVHSYQRANMQAGSVAFTRSMSDSKLVEDVAITDQSNVQALIPMISSNLIKSERDEESFSYDLGHFDNETISYNSQFSQMDQEAEYLRVTKRKDFNNDLEFLESLSDLPIKRFKEDVLPGFSSFMDVEPIVPMEVPSHTDFSSIGEIQPISPIPTGIPSEQPLPTTESKKIRLKIQVYHVGKTGDGPKPWICDAPNCNKTFSDSSNLIKHIRTHTAEKPYSCDICNKSFSHKSSMKEHMNTHSGSRPFVCEVCGKSFGQSSNLTRHQRLHTGEKPFSCVECGKDFNQSTNLKTHQQKFHSK